MLAMELLSKHLHKWIFWTSSFNEVKLNAEVVLQSLTGAF